VLVVERSLKNVHLVTYGGDGYFGSREILKHEALRFGITNVHVFGPERLPATFVQKHGEFLRKNRKGEGFWLWKQYIVREVLSHIEDGDLLFYADAGCAINPNGRKRFFEWMAVCEDKSSISFRMHHLEKYWTKKSVARLMNCETAEIMNSGQIMGGIFGIKKNKYTVDLVQEWLEICSLEWTIDDSVQGIKNDPQFKEHRHDQSVFSLLRKRERCYAISDETYPADGKWNNPSIGLVPIWAFRRRV
jgi:hypothetical protein